MLANLEFSFENDFQKLCVEVRVSQSFAECSDKVSRLEYQTHKIEYKVMSLSNVDFVCASDSWISFSGDSDKWLERFENIGIQEWNSFYDATNNPFPDVETKWSLCVEETKEAKEVEDFGKGEFSFGCKKRDPKTSMTIYGHSLYPVDFDSFLDLLKDLLNIPVLLLEL